MYVITAGALPFDEADLGAAVPEDRALGAKFGSLGAGVCLYVITAGALPFDEPNLGALFQKIARADYHTPTWFSEELAHLLHAILTPDPKARSAPGIPEDQEATTHGGHRPCSSICKDQKKRGAGTCCTPSLRPTPRPGRLAGHARLRSPSILMSFSAKALGYDGGFHCQAWDYQLDYFVEVGFLLRV